MTPMLVYGAIVLTMIILALYEAHQETAEQRASKSRRWTANLGLAALNMLVALSVPLSAISAALVAKAQGYGVMNMFALPYAVEVALSLVMLTLTSYAIHRAFHEIPLLWRLHQIHHCDDNIDSTTAFRHHPVEVVLTGLLTAIVVIFTGVDPQTALVLSLVDQAWAVWTHSARRLPLQMHRRVSAVLVTPLTHQVHHSADVRETNMNYGNTTTLWDQLFGTYLVTPLQGAGPVKTGLSQYQTQDVTKLDFLLWLPFRKGG